MDIYPLTGISSAAIKKKQERFKINGGPNFLLCSFW